MNIDINLIPEELRVKPLVDGKTLAAIAVVVLLAFSAFYFYHAKSSSQASIADMQSQITMAKQQTTALSGNAEALKLISSINQLKAAKQSYDAFTVSKVMLGHALYDVYSLVPEGVRLSTITEKGSTLVITGITPSYTEVSDYGRALNNDARFTLVGLPSLSLNKEGQEVFSLTISVAPGGDR